MSINSINYPINNNQLRYNNQNASNKHVNFTGYQGSEGENLTGAVCSAGLLQAIAIGLQKASQWCGQKLMQGKEFTTFDKTKEIAQTMVKDNDLKVDVGFIDSGNIHKYANKYGAGVGRELDVVAKGGNAFYADSLKLAVAPKGKPSLILHELGHAINATKGKFMKFMQKSRAYAPMVTTGLLLANSVMPKKADGKKNFIERNAGLLGFTAFLPTVVEEGMASIRGVGAAKKVLGKGFNLNALKRNYAFAWATYLIAGIGMGVATKQAFAERDVNREIYKKSQKPEVQYWMNMTPQQIATTTNSNIKDKFFK